MTKRAKKIRRLIAIFYFSPRKRKFKEAKQYLTELRANPEIAGNQVNSKLKNYKDHIKELVDTMTDTLSERFKNRKEYKTKLEKILFHPMVEKNDSINNSEVRKLIEEGLEIMENSRDPIHDISHVYRCIKIAKFHMGLNRLKHKIDWGTLVTALVWHDASRTFSPGLPYRSKLLKPLELLPFLIDANIIFNGLTDAERSVKMFKKAAEKYNLDQNFNNKVIQGILSTSSSKKRRELATNYDIICKIISDADAIDVYSIGRLEAAFININEYKTTSKKYLNRSFLMASYLKQTFRQNLKIKSSEKLFDFYLDSLNKHGENFYPNDSIILSA